MELLWTAFVLGFFGSLHCAGMCGPLAAAMPVVGNTRLSFTATRAVYNAGRIATYCVIGGVVGVIGKSIALAGLQRWISLGAGIVLLIGLLLSSRINARLPLFRIVVRLKCAFGALLKRRSFAASFLLGAINGLLPCGLVYVAAAGAVTGASVVHGIAYMAAFGVGTLPVMLGIGLAGRKLQFTFRLRLQKLIPVAVATLAILLVVRGMALGIPYLSPDLVAGAAGHSCH